jgi:hypothetical protein
VLWGAIFMGLCIWVTFFKIKECAKNYYGCKNELQGCVH